MLYRWWKPPGIRLEMLQLEAGDKFRLLDWLLVVTCFSRYILGVTVGNEGL